MIETNAIRLTNNEKFLVTWDVGRRCNFDCTYCEASRHDNISQLHSYEDLFHAFNFIKTYTEDWLVNINFTGGEPTINKSFWRLSEHIRTNESRFRLSLTTNGAWDPKNTERIARWFGGVTVSYHAEGHEILKRQTLQNIKLLHQTGIWLQVNVMMHTDYFDECVAVCEQLRELGIKHNPRPIGDGNVLKKGWFIDSDGIQRRTNHEYNKNQTEWYREYLGVDNIKDGRSCCGSRCIQGKVKNEWQNVSFINTNFKGWFCSVDKYFLHLDQHTGNVYHHQTCQALHNNSRGPIGNLNDVDKILEYKNNNKTKIIVCPNDRCGCGMCVPKAKERSDYLSILDCKV